MPEIWVAGIVTIIETSRNKCKEGAACLGPMARRARGRLKLGLLAPSPVPSVEPGNGVAAMADPMGAMVSAHGVGSSSRPSSLLHPSFFGAHGSPGRDADEGSHPCCWADLEAQP